MDIVLARGTYQYKYKYAVDIAKRSIDGKKICILDLSIEIDAGAVVNVRSGVVCPLMLVSIVSNLHFHHFIDSNVPTTVSG